MKTLQRFLISSAAVGLVLGGLYASICVPDGTKVTVHATRPTNPPAGTWTSTAPEMEEADMTDPDDPMGDASITSTGDTSGGVTNSGGDLFGKTGGDQNGGTEGDCIDVRFCWEYTYFVPAGWYPVPGLVDPETGQGVYQYVHAHWETDWHCSDIQEVCPCGSSECPAGTAPC